MPNALKQNWDSLVNRCQEAGLKVPVLTPLGLGAKLSITIESSKGSKHRVSSEDLNECMYLASGYVSGYANSLDEEDETSYDKGLNVGYHNGWHDGYNEGWKRPRRQSHTRLLTKPIEPLQSGEN